MAVLSLLWPLLLLATHSHGDFLPLGEELIQQLERAVSGVLELPLQYNVKDNEEFEYVVVGAGAAGCAVAARLALAGRSVLLLEAGGEPSPLTWVPYAAMALLGSSMDWQYRTIPNNVSCLSSEGQQCRFSRGRTLGGSTAINYMMYVRGNRADYELGLPGWTWDEIKPFFLRPEGLRDLDKYPTSSIPYHNTTGTLNIGYCADPENEWHGRIFEGLKELGFPYNVDVNGVSQIGVTRVVTYTADGKRVSTARGYLNRDDVKRALRVSTGTHVTGVVLDENNVARGVTVVRSISGRKITVRASRGVVLSAGALATPQILMLSGIGPASSLNKFGIPTRVDLPVGENLNDHVLPLVFIQVKNKLLKIVASLGTSALRYGISQDGPFASIGLTDTAAFVNTLCYDTKARLLRNNSADCELPTLQLINALIPRGAVSVGTPLFKQTTLLSNDVIAQLAVVNAEYSLIVVSPVVLAPKSRGWVSLASTDPLDPPAIFPNYLSDEQDVQEMLRSITIIEHLVETTIYKDSGASILHLSLPGCPEYGVDRTGYWACYVRHMTFSVYHAVGTCALGSVLDERMSVQGVDGLHVADLSAWPRVPRGNTAATAIALGERLAHFLIEDDKNITRTNGEVVEDKRTRDKNLVNDMFDIW